MLESLAVVPASKFNDFWRVLSTRVFRWVDDSHYNKKKKYQWFQYGGLLNCDNMQVSYQIVYWILYLLNNSHFSFYHSLTANKPILCHLPFSRCYFIEASITVNLSEHWRLLLHQNLMALSSLIFHYCYFAKIWKLFLHCTLTTLTLSNFDNSYFIVNRLNWSRRNNEVFDKG